jgi:hypothetical protein
MGLDLLPDRGPITGDLRKESPASATSRSLRQALSFMARRCGAATDR